MGSIHGRITGVGLGLRWAFLDEVVEGNVPNSIAFFEASPENYMRRGGSFPELLFRVAEHHPLLTHGLMMNLGSTDPQDPTYFGDLRIFLDHLGVERHSDHLCWSAIDGRNLHDLLPLPHDPRVVSHVADRILWAQDRLKRPLSVENISYYVTPDALSGLQRGKKNPGMAFMRELEFIHGVVDQAQCGLLLDVNNVLVNAGNHGFDAHEFVRQLPLDRVSNIHVAGGERLESFDNLIIDTHGSDVNEAVRNMMIWVVQRIGPVPVLYERDNNIPSLQVLGEQVAVLADAYESALGRYEVDRSMGKECESDFGGQISGSITVDEDHRGYLDAIERGLGRAILGLDDVESLDAARLRRQGICGEASELILSLPRSRVGVYRRLVRNSVHRTVNNFLPRTAVHRGEAAFAGDVDRWMHEEGPVSRYLRDLPMEFVKWAGLHWVEDLSVADYLADLAEYELLEEEVGASPPNPSPPTDTLALMIDSTLSFCGSSRLVRYQHRVHEIRRLTNVPPKPPAAVPVDLLAYRDAEHDLRVLEISEPLSPLIRALMDGKPLGEAARAGASASGVELNDSFLARASHLIADLYERGVILGIES